MSFIGDASLATRQAEYLEDQEAETKKLAPPVAETKGAQPFPIFWKVAFGVLVGNLMTAVVIGGLYYLSR